MLRFAIFWIHLSAGVIAGAIVLLMSVTGVALTYEKQMVRWADRRTHQAINAPVTSQLSADSLLSIASATRRGVAPIAITLRADPTEAALVSFGPAGVLYLHPTTGDVLGPGATGTRAFVRAATNWHRWLAGEGPDRARGRAITGAANLAFLLLVLTGMVLWLPKTLTWLQVRSVLWFRANLSAKAREFNWHNVLGIWSAVPLIAIVASGVVISYPWAGDLIYTMVGEAPPPRNPDGPTREGAARSARANAARAVNASGAALGASVADAAPAVSRSTARQCKCTPRLRSSRSISRSTASLPAYARGMCCVSRTQAKCSDSPVRPLLDSCRWRRWLWSTPALHSRCVAPHALWRAAAGTLCPRPHRVRYRRQHHRRFEQTVVRRLGIAHHHAPRIESRHERITL